MIQELSFAQQYIYNPCGLICSNIEQEVESKEYAACSFEIAATRVLFRAAKITPTKIGQFVTIWKRIGFGPIMPFDQSDPIDLFVIQVRYGDRYGQFVFPQLELAKWDYISVAGKGGKRAMRVYPSWDRPVSKQAVRTQAWQREYFFEAVMNGSIDKALVIDLYSK